jgi:hypothetical protein
MYVAIRHLVARVFTAPVVKCPSMSCVGSAAGSSGDTPGNDDVVCSHQLTGIKCNGGHVNTHEVSFESEGLQAISSLPWDARK